jgi:hypothetical protein
MNPQQQPPHAFFIASRVKELDDDAVYSAREWYLAFDSSHFHVYVIVALQPPQVMIRIDWNDESTLTFKRMLPGQEKYESRVLLGTTDFSKRRVEHALAPYMRDYGLFRFNCRTVSFIVLYTAGFDADDIYAQYARNNVLCGVAEGECFNMDSLRQYLHWRQEKQLRSIAESSATGGGECILC